MSQLNKTQQQKVNFHYQLQADTNLMKRNFSEPGECGGAYEYKEENVKSEILRMTYLPYERYNKFYYLSGEYNIYRGQIEHAVSKFRDEGFKVYEKPEVLSVDQARCLNILLSECYKVHLKKGVLYRIKACEKHLYVLLGKDSLPSTITPFLIPSYHSVGDIYMTDMTSDFNKLSSYKVECSVAILQSFINWIRDSKRTVVDSSVVYLLGILGAEVDYAGRVKYRGEYICMPYIFEYKYSEYGYPSRYTPMGPKGYKDRVIKSHQPVSRLAFREDYYVLVSTFFDIRRSFDEDNIYRVCMFFSERNKAVTERYACKPGLCYRLVCPWRDLYINITEEMIINKDGELTLIVGVDFHIEYKADCEW